MDDETYVKKDFVLVPGHQFYYKYKGKDVENKFAFCSCGLCFPPFITRQTLTADIYIMGCLKKRLLPLIKSQNISTLFWPDLASNHYSKKIIEWYEQNKVSFVPKSANPSYRPEERPIESYWSIAKGHLRNSGKQVVLCIEKSIKNTFARHG